jgi:hypothetical protein
MSVFSTAQRTLVKSPPELWDELSNPELLARHLEGLGEIRVTRAEHHTAVEWEAEHVSGSVRLEPSGFGTRVMLSLSRELVEPAAAEAESTPVVAAPTEDEPQTAESQTAEPQTAEPQTAELQTAELLAAEPLAAEPLAAEPQTTVVEEKPTPEPEQAAEAPPMVEPRQVEPRQGFFARLFKRRRKQIAPVGPSRTEPAAVSESDPVPVIEPEPVLVSESESVPMIEPDPATVSVESEPGEVVVPEPEPVFEPAGPLVADMSADLATPGAEMAEHDEAMLTAMLDRLGAAHHRPFSRS